MKIMIMSDLAPLSMGGGETYVTELGAHLTKKGHEVHWLTSRIPNTKDYANYKGINMHRITLLFSKKFHFPARQRFPFMAALRKLEFLKDMDIVQANALIAGYLGTCNSLFLIFSIATLLKLLNPCSEIIFLEASMIRMSSPLLVPPGNILLITICLFCNFLIVSSFCFNSNLSSANVG